MGVENFNIITINLDQPIVSTELSEQQEINEDNAWDILKGCLNIKIQELYSSNQNIKIYEILEEIYDYIQGENFHLETKERINNYVYSYCGTNFGIS